jgi:hypothetical protein
VRSLWTYLFIWLLGATAASGQATVDSLENALKQNIPDSSRIAVLISLSREYQYTNINLSRELAEKALRVAEAGNIRKQKIRAYQNLGALYAISGDYSSALRYDNLALQSSLENRDSANLSIDYNNVAMISANTMRRISTLPNRIGLLRKKPTACAWPLRCTT